MGTVQGSCPLCTFQRFLSCNQGSARETHRFQRPNQPTGLSRDGITHLNVTHFQTHAPSRTLAYSEGRVVTVSGPGCIGAQLSMRYPPRSPSGCSWFWHPRPSTVSDPPHTVDMDRSSLPETMPLDRRTNHITSHHPYLYRQSRSYPCRPGTRVRVPSYRVRFRPTRDPARAKRTARVASWCTRLRRSGGAGGDHTVCVDSCWLALRCRTTRG